MIAHHPSNFHQPSNSKRNFNYNAFIYTDIKYHAHFHSNYELIYVINGEMPLTVNGVAYRLEEGTLFLLNPYAVHSFEVTGEARVWVGVFSDDHIPAYVSQYGSIQWSDFKCDPKIEASLCEGLFFQGKPERYLRIAYLYMMCNECIKHARSIGGEGDRTFMQQVISYILDHIDCDIQLKELADYYSYEYHYFSALFHRCFFMNFKAFLNIFRIERACRLLLEDGGDVTSVYRRCGFSSIRNFNRVFKASMGCTPTEYRNSKAE